MDKKSETRPFTKSPERKISIRKSEPELKRFKLSFKEIVISIGVVLGGILGILMVIALLISIVVVIVSNIKAIIYMLNSYMNDV